MEQKRYDEIAAMIGRATSQSQDGWRSAARELLAELPERRRGAFKDVARMVEGKPSEAPKAWTLEDWKRAAIVLLNGIGDRLVNVQPEDMMKIRQMVAGTAAPSHGAEYGWGAWKEAVEALLAEVEPAKPEGELFPVREPSEHN